MNDSGIEQLCTSIGKKTNQVGRELGTSSASVTQWKNGSVPSGEKLVQIADHFNVTTDSLLWRTNESNVMPGNEEISNDMPVSDPDRDKTAEEFMQIFSITVVKSEISNGRQKHSIDAAVSILWIVSEGKNQSMQDRQSRL